MGNVPVGRTIARAYGFFFERIVAILGLSWLPATLCAVSTYYWLQRICSVMLVSPRPAGGGLNEYALFDLAALVVVAVFASATMAVPLTRDALNSGGELFAAYFAVGVSEAKMFFALLRFFALLVCVAFTVVYAGRIASAAMMPLIGIGEWQGVPVQTLLIQGVTVVATGIVSFLAVRFGFFLATIAVAEPHDRLARAWTLSRKNFWRLALIVVAISPPALFLLVLAGIFLWGDVLGSLNSAVAAHHSAVLYRLLNDNALSIAVISSISLVAFSALFAGASAIAYEAAVNALTDEEINPVQKPLLAEPAFARAFANYSPRASRADTGQRIEPRDEPLPGSTLNATPDPVVVTHEAKTAEEPHGMVQPQAVAEIEPVAVAPSDVSTSAQDQTVPHSAIEELAPVVHMPPGEMPPLDPAGLAAAAMPCEIASSDAPREEATVSTTSEQSQTL